MKYLALFCLFLLTACANPLAVKKTVPPGTVGQAVQVGTVSLAVVRAARSQSTANQPVPAGQPNLIVQLSVRNDGDSAVTIDPSAFTVEDDQKKSYTSKEPFPQPAFTSKLLNKGESNAGLIAFEVPASQTLTLIFRPPQQDFDVVRVNLTP